MMDEFDSIALILEQVTGYPVKREWRFHHIRKWRFDYAIPEIKLAAECEGGLWVRGRHTRGQGYLGDMEKYNAAALLGWTVLRYSPTQTDKMIEDFRDFVKGGKK